MQLLKGLVFLLFAGSIWACTSPSVEVVKETKGIEIISSVLEPYQLTDTIYVNGIDAEFYNHGESEYYKYIVNLIQGENNWSDTMTFFAHQGETARLQMIFAESIIDSIDKATYTGQLILIQDTTHAR